MITKLIFDGGLSPVIRDLLPPGVRPVKALDKIRRAGNCLLPIEGEDLPDADYVRMRVTLDLVDDAPVRTVTFEPVAA